MKKAIIKYFFLLLSIIFFQILATSCSTQREEKYSEIRRLTWLIGRWEFKTNEGIISEEWKKMNDSTYSGLGYFIQGDDTISSEKIQLIQFGKVLKYIPTVENQNGGKAVEFSATSDSENEIVFENVLHDYPQMIVYKRITHDSIIAEISGKINGIKRKESFNFSRKN